MGSGIACVSIVILDDNGNILHYIPKQLLDESEKPVMRSNDLKSVIELESHYRAKEISNENLVSRCFKILINVWSHGSINLEYLCDTIAKCFKDSIFDYCTEAEISKLSGVVKTPHIKDLRRDIFDDEAVGPVMAHEDSANTVMLDENLETLLQSTLDIMKLAADFKNQSIQELTSSAKLPPLIVEEFATDVCEFLLDISKALNPVLLKRSPDTSVLNILRPNKFNMDTESTLETKVKSHADSIYEQSSSDNDKIIIVAGVKAFSDSFGYNKLRAFDERKSSFDSESSSGFSTPTHFNALHGRWPSVDESSIATPDSLLSKRFGKKILQSTSNISSSSIDDFMLYPKSQHQFTSLCSSRNCFALVIIENSSASIFTYNWNRTHCDILFSRILRSLSWNNIRMQFLENHIKLSQKQQYIKSQELKYENNVISYSSSYGGVGGFSLAGKEHFESRLSDGHKTFGENISNAFIKMYSMDADILQRRAVDVLESFIMKHLQNSQKQIIQKSTFFNDVPSAFKYAKSTSAITGISNSFMSDLDPLETSEKHELSFSASDIAAILRSIKLFYFRYPIFFTELRHYIFKSPENNILDIHNDTDRQALSFRLRSISAMDPNLSTWFTEMICCFVNSYVDYMKNDLGLESLSPEEMAPENSHMDSLPTYIINQTLTIPAKDIYLKKKLSLGLAVVQIGVDQFHACANLYVLKYSKSNHDDEYGNSYGLENESEKQFKSECALLKSRIHINSCKLFFFCC